MKRLLLTSIAFALMLVNCGGDGSPTQSQTLPAPLASTNAPAPTKAAPFDFTGGGCFPPKNDCWRIPDEVGRKRCEDFQAQRSVSWPAGCEPLPNPACAKMCQQQVGKMPGLEISTPVKISNNPKGYRGWPWPHLFIRDNQLLVQYWGVVNDWISSYVTQFDGQKWSQPKGLKPESGTLVLGDSRAYLLNWAGSDGFVNLAILDKKFNTEKIIPVFPERKSAGGAWPLGAVDSKGNLHIAWNVWVDGKWELRYAAYDRKDLTGQTTIVSTTIPQYGTAPYVVIDSHDVVYFFWSMGVASNSTAGPTPATHESYGRDEFYAYLKEGKWSKPINLTNAPAAVSCWSQGFANGADMHWFGQVCAERKTADIRRIVFRDGTKFSEELFSVPVTNGHVAFEGPLIHLVASDGLLISQTADRLVFKHKVAYNFFDGKNWHTTQILPSGMVENSEGLVIDPTPGVPESQLGIAPDGSREFVHEEHPEAAFLNGMLHIVFEYNDHGTYDAYYMTIRRK